MPHPDDFAAAAFARRFGSPAHDRRDDAIASMTAPDRAAAEQLRAVLRTAIAGVSALHFAVACPVPGHDFDSILAQLRDLLPPAPDAVAALLQEAAECQVERLGEAA